MTSQTEQVLSTVFGRSVPPSWGLMGSREVPAKKTVPPEHSARYNKKEPCDDGSCFLLIVGRTRPPPAGRASAEGNGFHVFARR